MFLGTAAAVLGSALGEPVARASLVRGLSLAELVRKSGHAVVGTPLEAHSDWAVLGGQRLIVTDTRVRVEETLALAPTAEREVFVRVLGGSIGELGERVDGQAELVLGEVCTLFLTPVSPVLSYVTGMAQGHYALRADAQKVQRLRPSPHLPTLVQPKLSAVASLAGRTLAEARTLVRAVAP